MTGPRQCLAPWGSVADAMEPYRVPGPTPTQVGRGCGRRARCAGFLRCAFYGIGFDLAPPCEAVRHQLFTRVCICRCMCIRAPLCMCMWTYSFMYMCVYVNNYVHTYPYIRSVRLSRRSTCRHKHRHRHADVYIHTHTYMCTHWHICTQSCTYTRAQNMHADAYRHLHTFVHMPWHLYMNM